jgi:hypothetical protein
MSLNVDNQIQVVVLLHLLLVAIVVHLPVIQSHVVRVNVYTAFLLLS